MMLDALPRGACPACGEPLVRHRRLGVSVDHRDLRAAAGIADAAIAIAAPKIWRAAMVRRRLRAKPQRGRLIG